MMQQSGRLQTGAGGVSRVHLQGQAATALPAAVHRFVAPRLQCSRLAHTWRHGVAVSPVGGPGPRLVLASVAATSTSQVADDDELPEASTLGKLAELFAEAMNEQALQQEEVTETVYQIKDEEMFNTINKMISEIQPSQAVKARFCTNCHVPRAPGHDACIVCGHRASADGALVGEHMVARWRELLAKQHGLKPDGTTTTKTRRRKGEPRVALAFDERMLAHKASLMPYPERPERLTSALARLDAADLLSRCQLMAVREASDSELAAVHSRELIDALAAASTKARTRSGASASSSSRSEVGGSGGKDKGFVICADAMVSADTYLAARLAAGAAAQVAEGLVLGDYDAGVAVVRPPGHHASYSTAQSGCYFNNAAVAARAAQAAGAERVLILDWDVHHCQGTQELFQEDTSVLVASLHRFEEEYYPGTGDVTDVGVGDGEGYTVNIPWQDNTVTDADYMQALSHVLLPIALEFQPDLVILSAGFDAAQGDPLGGCAISPACFANMTYMLQGVAPVMMLLEGGYNLDATAKCLEACTRVLLGSRPPRFTSSWEMSRTGTVALMNAMQVQSQFWESIHPLSLNGWMSAIRDQQEARRKEAAAAAGSAAAAAFGQRMAAAGGASGLGAGSNAGSSRSDDDEEEETAALLQELLRQAPRETAGTVVQVKSSSKGSGADAGSRGGKGTASSGSGGGSVSLGDGVEISEDEWLALMEAGEALEAEEAAAAASKGRGASSSKSG